MTDEVIVGLFTLGGTLLGFGLSKISDIITVKRERQRYQNLLRFKSYSIKEKIDSMIKQVNKTEKITNQESIEIIEEFLLKNDIKEEISKLESIMDKIVKSNYDEKEREYFAILSRIKFSLNFLLYLSTIHAHETQDEKEPQDEKPLLIQLLTTISKDIDYLSQVK